MKQTEFRYFLKTTRYCRPDVDRNTINIIIIIICFYVRSNSVKTSDVRKAIVAYTGKSENDKEVQDLIQQVRGIWDMDNV